MDICANLSVGIFEYMTVHVRARWPKHWHIFALHFDLNNNSAPIPIIVRFGTVFVDRQSKGNSHLGEISYSLSCGRRVHRMQSACEQTEEKSGHFRLLCCLSDSNGKLVYGIESLIQTGHFTMCSVVRRFCSTFCHIRLRYVFINCSIFIWEFHRYSA